MKLIEGPAWRNLGRLVALAIFACCTLMPVAQAQDSGSFSNEELDQMLAPIALYPDSLLSQILMASTYPADVRAAADWSKAHPDDKGDAAVQKVEGQEWDPSVKSLVAFPQVLAMMREKPNDVQRLGDAFLADPGRVMDRVQFLRKRAQDSGNLKSNQQQKVETQTVESKQVIVIEPAQPQTVYVPVYQPSVVYGSWMYPSYPPYYWPPPAYYYPGAAFVGGVIWGAAMVGISNSLWGGFGWGHNDVNINVNKYNNINRNNQINNNKFQHNPDRRGDVPYRDSKSKQQYGQRQQASAGARDREAYRGKDARPDARDADRARAQDAMKQRGVDTGGASRDRAQAASRDMDRAGGAGGRDMGGGTRDMGSRDMGGGAGTRDMNRGGMDNRGAGPSNAMSGVRDPGASRANLDRGQASMQSMNRGGGGASARPSPSPSARPAGGGGGGGARAGGGGGGGRGGRR